jgi:hypothetical protein
MSEKAPEKAARLDPVKEAQAVAALRESLAAVDAEDEALLLDTVEGETSLFEAIDLILERIVGNQAMVDGMKAAEDRLAARRQRYEKRVETDRTLIEQALALAELQKVERPLATLSMSKRTPSLVVLEEADIPADYFKAADPKLDRKALTDALKARAKALDDLPEAPEARAAALAALPPEIPGATLSNAAPILTARFQ